MGESPAVISHTLGSVCDGNCARESGGGLLSMGSAPALMRDTHRAITRNGDSHECRECGEVGELLVKHCGVGGETGRNCQGPPKVTSCPELTVRAGLSLFFLLSSLILLSLWSSLFIASCLNRGNADRSQSRAYVFGTVGGELLPLLPFTDDHLVWQWLQGCPSRSRYLSAGAIRHRPVLQQQAEC